MPPGDDNTGSSIFGDMFKNLGEQARKDFEASFQPNFDFDKITTLMDEIETGAAEVANKFGQGRVNMVALQASMGDALAKVTEMGGSFNDIVSAQKDITSVLGRNLIVQSETFEKLYATQKITGQDTQSLVKGFKDAGFSLSHIQDEMKKVVEIAQKQGVSAQAVSKQVVSNMDALNKYNFEGGVAGMAKMAAQATSLRIDMKTALDFADKMFNPEQAIEMSAALQRLGVTQSQLLDPLRMMDLAQNDPAELQNQIVEMTKGFVQLNKAGQFEILPDGKRQLREIAQAMNIPYEQLTKMAIGSKELEEKMSKIRFPAEFQDEEAQKMIANMAEFNKETQRYEITYTDPKTGQAVTKDVEKVTPEDIALAQKEAGKSMEDLTKEQVSTSKRIENILAAMATKSGVVLAGSGFVEKGRASTVSTYEAIAEPFNRKTSDLNTKKLRSTLETKGSEGFDALMQGDFDKAFKTLGEGEKYLEGALNQYVKDVGTNFSKLAKSGDPVIQGFMKVGGFLKNWVAENEKIAPKPGENKGDKQKIQAKDFIVETYEKDTLIAGGTKLGEKGNETSSKVDVGGTIKLEITATGDTDALKRELETNPSLSQMITMKVIQSVNPNINPNEMNQKLSDMSYNNLG